MANSKTIELDGCPFLIGHSLHQALQQLRQDKLDRPIWIDAICIDQADNSEKAEQVAMMRDIYKRAECVVVWLGTTVRDGAHEGSWDGHTAHKQHSCFQISPFLTAMARDCHFHELPGSPVCEDAHCPASMDVRRQYEQECFLSWPFILAELEKRFDAMW
jgi:hypothetical protein